MWLTKMPEKILIRKYARYLILKVRLTQKSEQKETALLGGRTLVYWFL